MPSDWLPRNERPGRHQWGPPQAIYCALRLPELRDSHSRGGRNYPPAPGWLGYFGAAPAPSLLRTSEHVPADSGHPRLAPGLSSGANADTHGRRGSAQLGGAPFFTQEAARASQRGSLGCASGPTGMPGTASAHKCRKQSPEQRSSPPPPAWVLPRTGFCQGNSKSTTLVRCLSAS